MAYTIPAAAAWPAVLKRERSLTWKPDFGNEASPPALDGTRQYRNTNGGGLWRASFQNFQLMTREQVLAWEGTEVLLRGGMTPVDVPFCGYRLRRSNPASPVTLKSTGGWAARAVNGRVTVGNASGDLVGGIHFSDDDGGSGGVYGWRLYRIDSIVANISPGVFDITFWPPARKAVANNHPLEIEDPKCVMRLAASDSMDLALELRRRGNPNAEFVEAF
jgi:hypothetical protein